MTEEFIKRDPYLAYAILHVKAQVIVAELHIWINPNLDQMEVEHVSRKD